MTARLKKFLELIQPYLTTDNLKNDLIDRFLDSEKMYEDLRNAGYPDELTFPHTTAYINALKPLPDDFIAIVIKWLPDLKHKEIAIGFLREAEHKYDGQVLIPIFIDGDFTLKWKIADAIAYNPPLGINEWVKETYLSVQYGQEAGLLALAIIKMFQKEEAIGIIKQGFDLHPEVAPEALGKVGGIKEIDFLEEKSKLPYKAKFIYKEIEKAIKKIKKRCKSS